MTPGVAACVFEANDRLRVDRTKRLVWEADGLRTARHLEPAVVPEERPEWLSAYEWHLGWAPGRADGSEEECATAALECLRFTARDFHPLLPAPMLGDIAPPYSMQGQSEPGP